MPDRLGWICPRCFTAVSPDSIDCAACSPGPVTSGPFKPDQSGAVFAPMREDLTATPGQVRDLQAALTAAAGGMLAVKIVVLPPGSKVMVPVDLAELVAEREAGEGRRTLRLPAYMGHHGAVQRARVTTVWAEVFPGLEASLRSVRTGVAEVDFRLIPQEDGQAVG